MTLHDAVCCALVGNAHTLDAVCTQLIGRWRHAWSTFRAQHPDMELPVKEICSPAGLRTVTRTLPIDVAMEKMRTWVPWAVHRLHDEAVAIQAAAAAAAAAADAAAEALAALVEALELEPNPPTQAEIEAVGDLPEMPDDML